MGQRGSRQVASNAAPMHVEGAQEGVSQDLMGEMIEFLKVDLPNLFNEKGIDKSKYDEKVAFIDPITKYDSLSGYLLNIQVGGGCRNFGAGRRVLLTLSATILQNGV